MGKSKTSTINIFLLLLFYKEKIIFCQKTYLEKLIFLHLCYCFFFVFFCVVGYQKCRTITSTPIQTGTGLADAVLRLKILGNRINTLPQILLTMDCYFLFLCISEKYLQFRKKTKAFVKENFWFTPYKNPDLLTAELFFKLCISQRYVQNIERN